MQRAEPDLWMVLLQSGQELLFVGLLIIVVAAGCGFVKRAKKSCIPFMLPQNVEKKNEEHPLDGEFCVNHISCI